MRTVSVILLTSASLLVALGDLRNVISPAGYWISWSVWLSIAMLSAFASRPFSLAHSALAGAQIHLVVGFPVLVFAFLVSAVINADVETLYQGIKLIVIAIIGLFLSHSSHSLARKDIAAISGLIILSAFAIFEFAKHIALNWYVQLGDGRQGTVLAYPGVLWKTGAFFSAFLLARFFCGNKMRARFLLLYIVSVYLVFMDGSRTGFLWLAVVLVSFVMMRLIDFAKPVSLPAIIFSLIGATLGGGLLLAKSSDIGLADYAVVAARLTEGDPVRAEMIGDGITLAEKCLPFGCGFGAAVTQTAEGSMVIHNAFLSSLADVGIVGFAGLLIIVFGPLLAALQRLPAVSTPADGYYLLAAAMGVLGFAFSMFLHPLSTEMSEWGLFLIMAAWLSVPPRERECKGEG